MRILPKISIVIPSFNKVEFIGETLESIVTQKYPNLEVIIRDPGSSDGTIEIIKKFVNNYKSIFSLHIEKDRGQLDAINKGLVQASGEIVTFINADDIYRKGALEVVGNYFVKNPKTFWVAGKGQTIDEKGKAIVSWVDDYKNYLLKLNNYSYLLTVNYLFQPSIFLSRTAFQKYGPFIGTKTSVMEYDMWLKLGKVKMPEVVDSFLTGFRLIRGSLSSTEFKLILKADEKIVEKYTNNKALIMLHYLHNLGRVLTLNFLEI